MSEVYTSRWRISKARRFSISRLVFVVSLMLCVGLSSYASAQQSLTLPEAIELANKHDNWHKQSQLTQTAIEQRSIAAGQLPDPNISVSMMNLPVDSWRFNQEAMTQLKVGVSQIFPRGDTLALTQSRLKIEAQKHPLLRANRAAQVAAEVSLLWLDAYQASMIIELIEGDRVLFEQMAEAARSSYTTALQRTRQQDVIRASLELVQLDERLNEQAQFRDVALAGLNEWLIDYSALTDSGHASLLNEYSVDEYSVEETLPAIPALAPELLSTQAPDIEKLAQHLMRHPAVMAIDVSYQASQKQVQIAHQGYKPAWGLNASYSYRDDTPQGSSRADFFSVGVSMDLPLFTENKQDKQVAASIAESEAVKTEKRVLLKQMISKVQGYVKEISRLRLRADLYQTQLLQQSKDQAEAALNAYTTDDGDFAEVVRAKIAELNMRIAKLKIDIAMLKSTARLNYFLTQSDVELNDAKWSGK